MSLHLTMSLLVKNEADIIKENIISHAQLGVDSFVIIDNGSTDGTDEIIESLSKDYPIHIISRPVTDYRQSDWRTEMAFIAKKIFSADWVISNDADEFWIPNNDNIKSELSRWGSVILANRYDMQLTQDYQGKPFFHNDYRTNHPIDYTKDSILTDTNYSVQLSKIHGKVLVNTHGLIRVKGGNHRAWHVWQKLNQKKSSNITVYHYPIRSWELFVKNIENRKILLENGVSKMGDHYRRWVSAYNERRLEDEWEKLMLSDNDVSVLEKFGIIKKDTKAKTTIQKILTHHA